MVVAKGISGWKGGRGKEEGGRGEGAHRVDLVLKIYSGLVSYFVS